MVKYRLDIGWTVKEAFETPSDTIRNNPRVRRIVIQGQEYLISEVAKKYGINLNWLKHQIDAGRDIEWILREEIQKMNGED